MFHKFRGYVSKMKEMTMTMVVKIRRRKNIDKVEKENVVILIM